MPRLRRSSFTARTSFAVTAGLAIASVLVAVPAASTSAVPIEPVVLDDAPALRRHDTIETVDGRIVYVKGDDSISIFDPTTKSDEVLAAVHTPDSFEFPTLLGFEPERLIYESPIGTLNAVSLDGGSPSEFFVVPAGASISRFRQLGGGVVAMVVDLGGDQKSLYLFDDSVSAVPAPIASFTDEGFGSSPQLAADGEVVLTRTVGGDRTLSIVSAAGVRDIEAPIAGWGTNFAGAIGDERDLEIWYLTQDVSPGPVTLWVTDGSASPPTDLLSHPELAFPRFDFRGGDGIAMNETIYSRSGAFASWEVVPPSVPDGFVADVSISFSGIEGEEVQAFLRFSPQGGGASVNGGIAFYPLAGTEATRTVPPAEPEVFADDVYAVVRDFSGSFSDPAIALLVEEPGGTFGIRYRPAGGTEADETVVDSGATVRYAEYEVRFDDAGFRLSFIRDNTTLNFVSLLDGDSVEVTLQHDYATIDRARRTDGFGPGDVVVIDDQCDFRDGDSTCVTGSRLMYIDLPSIWIDPTLQSIVPVRVLETRTTPDAKTIDGEFQGEGRLAGGTVKELDLFGRTGVDVPDTASAVLLNVVAVNPAGVGFLTLFPCGSARPLAANVNYSGGDVAANAVFAKLGDGGKVCIFSEADTDLVVDVNGYVPFGGDNNAVVPARIYESRDLPTEKTIDGAQQGVGRITAGGIARVNVAGRADVPSSLAGSSAAGSAYLNVVAINPATNGFLTVFPCTDDRPLAASVNYSAGGVAPNAVLARLSVEGDVCIYSSAATDIVVDVNGYIEQFSNTVGQTPLRYLETRSGAGRETFDRTFEGGGKIAAGETLELTIHGRRSDFDRPGAVFLNIVAVAPATNGFITVFPCDSDRPLAANVNYRAGMIGYNAVFAKVGSTGKVCLYSSAATDLVVDVNGSVYSGFGR